jgi:hypothetical protein
MTSLFQNRLFPNIVIELTNYHLLFIEPQSIHLYILQQIEIYNILGAQYGG